MANRIVLNPVSYHGAGAVKEIVQDEDVQFRSESAVADACCPGNPRDTSVEEIAALYSSLM